MNRKALYPYVEKLCPKKEALGNHRLKKRSNHLLRENLTNECRFFINAKSPYGRHATEQRISMLNGLGKRSLDGFLALIALTLLSPLMLLIALLVKLDSPGPVFYQQQRTGYMGRRFNMYKFRTMVADADLLKSQYEHLNEHKNGSPDFKIKKDPRITRIGSFLRRYSLDEIPQFINVLLGDMRLVGPRPTSFAADTYHPDHLSRLLVYPGLTGLWQLSGRSDISFEERVSLDCEYILAQNPLIDLEILLKTPRAVMRGEGAY